MEKDIKIPQHVAIILDGNGRWAKSKGMPAITAMSREPKRWKPSAGKPGTWASNT